MRNDITAPQPITEQEPANTWMLRKTKSQIMKLFKLGDADLLEDSGPTGKRQTPTWPHLPDVTPPRRTDLRRHLPNHGQFRRLTADTWTTSGRRGNQRIEQSRSSRNHLASCKATPITSTEAPPTCIPPFTRTHSRLSFLIGCFFFFFSHRLAATYLPLFPATLCRDLCSCFLCCCNFVLLNHL